MSEFAIVVWTVGIIAWGAFALYVIWIARGVWNDRLVRCPETGAVTLVGVEYVSLPAGSAPVLTVRRCGLWPAKAGCSHACVDRYEDSLSGFWASVRALRAPDRV